MGLDAAQYGMLMDLYGMTEAPAPSESLLHSVTTSCLSQEQADSYYHVPWSRHLLACLHRILAVDLLVGARAVTLNPHFAHFYSPDLARASDCSLGAVQDWPAIPALLLLDSFAPEDRPGILEMASLHSHAVWILRLDQPSP